MNIRAAARILDYYTIFIRYVKWRRAYEEIAGFPGAARAVRGGAAVRGRILPRPGFRASDALQIDGSGEGKLCLNTATREELLALPGVGEKTADRILSYRDTYGRFSAVEQLMDVEGIGPTLLEQLRGLVTVDQTEG